MVREGKRERIQGQEKGLSAKWSRKDSKGIVNKVRMEQAVGRGNRRCWKAEGTRSGQHLAETAMQRAAGAMQALQGYMDSRRSHSSRMGQPRAEEEEGRSR